MKKAFILTIGLVIVFGSGFVASHFWSQSSYDGHSTHMASMEVDMHDEGDMPMLNGKDTTADEVVDLKSMFQNHKDITRSVELLPNGIKTTTESPNENLRSALVHHVASMITRVEQGQDPQIPIQSPTLDILFQKGSEIITEIETTDFGVSVIQTSRNPEVVAALQKHALEVSDLAARGMQAVHEQMMGQHN